MVSREHKAENVLFATAALAAILIAGTVTIGTGQISLADTVNRNNGGIDFHLTLIKSKCVRPLVTTLQSRVQDQVHVLPAPLTLLLKTAEMSWLPQKRV